MRVLAGLALAGAMMSFGSTAGAATVLSTCGAPTGCGTNASGNLNVDYTVPTDGKVYVWELKAVDDPTALISLAEPLAPFTLDGVSNGDGSANTSLVTPDFTWNEVIAPGLTTITVWAGADFNDCATAPKGAFCSQVSDISGDASLLHVSIPGASTPGVVTVTFSATGVPEPATWSLLIGGFFGLGWTLRRRRAGLRPA